MKENLNNFNENSFRIDSYSHFIFGLIILKKKVLELNNQNASGISAGYLVTVEISMTFLTSLFR